MQHSAETGVEIVVHADGGRSFHYFRSQQNPPLVPTSRTARSLPSCPVTICKQPVAALVGVGSSIAGRPFQHAGHRFLYVGRSCTSIRRRQFQQVGHGGVGSGARGRITAHHRFQHVGYRAPVPSTPDTLVPAFASVGSSRSDTGFQLLVQAIVAPRTTSSSTPGTESQLFSPPVVAPRAAVVAPRTTGRSSPVWVDAALRTVGLQCWHLLLVAVPLLQLTAPLPVIAATAVKGRSCDECLTRACGSPPNPLQRG